jgi:Fe-S-cluster-containing hydrogenase component 2
VKACHEGALGIVQGKARLLREDYCDGFGDCLPECPEGAIFFEEREAKPYDAQAVAAMSGGMNHSGPPFKNFPIQLKLVQSTAPRFFECGLLVAADCTAFVCDDFKRSLSAGKALAIGCPKLDATDYSGKLAEIIRANAVKSVTVAKMEVPCCGGLARMAEMAIAGSGADVLLEVITVTVEGKLQS